MVPEATFTSYYGRPVVKPSPWENDIPAYLFLGGLAAGSSLLAAGADLTGRPGLRTTGRLGALAGHLAVDGGAGARPRQAEPVRQHAAGRQAHLADVGRHLDPHRLRHARRCGRRRPSSSVASAACRRRCACPARLLAAVGAAPPASAPRLVAPAVASYTAVLLSDTATPSWHEAYRELPFVFVGSAAAASGGLGMIGAPVHEAGPARRLAVGGAAARAGRRAPDGAEHGHHRRAAAPGPGRHADEGEQDADRRRRRRARRCSGAAAASRRRCPGPRSWPGRRAPASPSSRPARPRPATPATPSCRSASGSSAARPSRLRRRSGLGTSADPRRPLCARESAFPGPPHPLCARESAFAHRLTRIRPLSGTKRLLPSASGCPGEGAAGRCWSAVSRSGAGQLVRGGGLRARRRWAGRLRARPRHRR